MDDPIKMVGKASSIAGDATSTVIALQAIGVSSDVLVTPVSTLACEYPNTGTAAAVRTLSVYSNGLEIVQDIGSAPEDKSYAGYIRQFKKNNEALTSKAKTDVQRQAEVHALLARQQARCVAMLAADLNASTTFHSLPGITGGATPAIVGTLISLDKLAKTLLEQAERLQREAAVRKTLDDLTPQFESATRVLAAEPNTFFGPLVVYDPSMDNEATRMNKSVLGAALTIDRWMTAKVMVQQWRALAPCRVTVELGTQCLGDAQRLAVANAFAANARKYQALSQLDAERLLNGISKATDAAKSASRLDGVGGFLDALMGLAGALSDVDAAYVATQKAD
ncbi:MULTISPECIES: hypothetical protein [Variovorax]|uniref:hypothetical protein n=1 Tax=Variovorax TaxID=34072 RepID=UPI001615B7F2|nr:MULTISPECIES: hypothetical protein [unclassified Variovorax]MBB3639657.1 hypothetical protein [Variovorax sp. BK613]MDN6886832.1 hypothetical protein [Variovorax sp. CAN15]